MLEKIIITASRTQIQEVVISKENGYDMPKTSQEFADLVLQIRNFPDQFIDSERWDDEDEKVESVQFIDKGDQKDD